MNPRSICVCLALCGLPIAARADTVARVRSDVDSLLARFDAVFVDGLDTPDAPCPTLLLADLRAAWGRLTPAQRDHVDRLSSPVYRAALAEGEPGWLGGEVGSRSTCFQPGAVNPGLGPYDHVDETEHFVFHWDEAGPVTPARMASLRDYFEDAWRIEIEEMGFYTPWGANGRDILVIVEDLGSNSVGGYTSVAQCLFSPSGSMPYIVVNTAWFGDTDSMRSLAPHELFHAIQMVYAPYELFFAEEQSRNRWLVEASAVYMQRQVFPNLFLPEAQQVLRWSFEPHRSLETADDSGLQYGLSIFLFSLEESLGSPDWHQDLWDQIYNREDYELRDEFDRLFEEAGTDFLTEWKRFVTRGMTMGYLDNPYWVGPLDLDEVGEEDRVVGDWDGRDYPLDEDVNSGSDHDRPEYLGTNFVRFRGANIDDDVGAVIRFRGAGEDGDVDWVVEMIAVYNGSVRATYDMPLSHGEDGDVYGEVLVNEIGEDFDWIGMAVSPVTDFGGGSLSWSYTAELLPSTDRGGFYPVPEDIEDDGPDTACAGCRTGGAAFLLPALPWLSVRRRRA
jgi:hypothetical protein